MTPRRDALRAGSHWHLDCRLEGELPKDDAVSGLFLANILVGTLAFSLCLVFAWLAHQTFKVSNEVRDLESHLTTSRSEVNNIRVLQREYVDEATKVDHAYSTIRPALFASEFIGALSRTLQPKMNIENLVWNDTEVTMRGFIRENRRVGTQILEDYIKALNADASISSQIIEIRPLGFTPTTPTNGNFIIKFRLRPLPPL